MRKRILIAVLLLLLLIPFIGVSVLFYTETGVNLVVSQLPRLERLGVHIEGVSGKLAGPLRITRFELNHPRVHIVSNDIVIYLQMRGLLLNTIQTGSLTARDSLVELHDVQTPPNNKPPRFLPPYLRIDARGVDLDKVRYVHTNGTVVDTRRVQGRVTVSSRQLRARGFSVDAEQFDAAGDLRLRAGDPISIEAKANGKLRMERGTEMVLTADVNGPLDRMAIKAQMQQPEVVSVDALFTRPNQKWNLAGKVVSGKLALDPWMDKPPLSFRNVALDVEANAERIHARGNVGIPEIDPENDMTVDASGRYAERVLHIASADIALNGTPSKLHAAGTVAFDGDAPTIDLAARWQSMQWPLHGQAIVASATGEATLRGPLPYDFTVNAQVSGPNIPPAQGTAAGVLTKEDVTLAQYSVQALEGSLVGDGRLQFKQPRAWKFSTRATDINPVTFRRELPGRVSFNAHAEGKGFDKKASFVASVSGLHGVLRGQPVRGDGTVQRDARGWVVKNAHVAYADAKLALDGTLRDTIDARWTLTAPALDKLLPDAKGALDFSGTASGPVKQPHVVAELRAQSLRYQEWIVSTLNVSADVDATNNSPSRLSVHAERAGHGEPLVSTLQMDGQGTATDHTITIDVSGIPPNPRDSAPRAEMKVTGRYEKAIWNAIVATTRLTRGEEELSIAEPAKVVASRDLVSLDNLCLIVSAGRLCATGKWQRNGQWEGSVAGYEIPLAMLLPPAGPEAEYSGRIEGRVHAFGSPGQPWQGEAGMRIIDAAIIYRPPGVEPETLNLGTGGLAATATPERINFSFGVQAFTDTFLYANAKLDRNGSNDILHLPLTGDMRARAADANILPLVVPEIDHAAGVLTANANITGTLALPRIDGRIELAKGELDSYRVNLALRELSLIADLASNGLDFRGNGKAGDGRVEVDGRFTWREGESGGNFRLHGENLLVADLPEYRIVASPDLRFVIDGKKINVSGDVVIPSVRVQPNQLTGAVKPSDDARYVGEHPAEREGRFIVHSEVRIVMGDDVRVDAFGLQGKIAGQVGTTVHTGEVTIGRGELSVQAGRYEAYGQKLEIARGRLLFEASPLDDPGLDIEARRKLETIEVGLNVRGTLQEPRLTFFSDPPMPQTQIASYLLTGKGMDSSAGSSTLTSTDALAMQGGGLLASRLGRRLGLEEVGVESSVDSAGQSNTALVLGKFLSPRLFISYGISLTESINTLKLRYTISDKWIFKTEAGENQSADLEYTIER